MRILDVVCQDVECVLGLGGIMGANVFTTQGGSKALPPSCVRVSHIVSEYRPLFFSIAPSM